MILYIKVVIYFSLIIQTALLLMGNTRKHMKFYVTYLVHLLKRHERA